MAVTYSVQFDVVPAERDRFLTLLDGVLDAMRHEPMFLQATLHEDPENVKRLFLVETREDHDDDVVERPLHRPYRQTFHAALPDVLTQPRTVTVWRIRRADRRGNRPCHQAQADEA